MFYLNSNNQIMPHLSIFRLSSILSNKHYTVYKYISCGRILLERIVTALASFL